MTPAYRARDLLLGLFLIVTGILIGLTFNAGPSQAQNTGGGSAYLAHDGQMWFCQARDCRMVRFTYL